MGSTLSTSQDRGHGWLASSIGDCAPMLRRQKHTARHSRIPKLSTRFQDINGSDSGLIKKPIQVVAEQIQLPRPVQGCHALERHSPDHSTPPSFVSAEAQAPSSCVPSRRSFSVGRPRTSRSGRPSISAPTDFRRLEEPCIPRVRSFQPLELRSDQAEGRLSPLPDFNSLHRDWEELRLPGPAAYRPRSTSLPQKLQSTFKIPRKALELRTMDTESRQAPADWPPRTHSKYPVDRQLPSLTTLYQQSSTTSPDFINAALPPFPQAPLPSHVRGPATSCISLPQSRRSSDRSVRRLKTDIDEAILELQTVVEEKRAISRVTISRPTTPSLNQESPSKYHVPAIAPSMKVTARSQTLSDIGSAFSRPLTPLTPRTMPLTAVKPLPEMPRREGETEHATAEPKPSQYLANKRPRHIRISQWILKSTTLALEGHTSTIPSAPKQVYELRTSEAEAGATRTSIKTISDSSLTSATSEPGFPNVSIPAATRSSYSPPSTASRPSLSKSAPVVDEVEIRSQVQVRIRRKKGSEILKVQVPPPAYAVEDPHPSPRTVRMAL